MTIGASSFHWGLLAYHAAHYGVVLRQQTRGDGMNSKAALFLTIAFSASFAAGQTDRALHFAHTEPATSLNQIATLIHVITDAAASPDERQKTLTLHGTQEQIALAEWLLGEIDKPQIPAPNNREEATHSYQLQGGGENTVRVFFLLNFDTAQAFQEVATAVRTTVDLRRAATYNGLRAFVTRGTPDQIALTTWLIDALDRPAGQRAVSRDYRMPLNSDPHGEIAVRLLYASNAATVQDFQQIATAVRTITDIRRLFTYNAARVIVARSTPEQIAMADWLMPQLDKPAVEKVSSTPVQSSGTYEYASASDRENMVKVLYLPQAETIEDFQRIATGIRTTTNVRRAFTYNAPRVMAVRGTIDQIAMAERMVKELDTPK